MLRDFVDFVYGLIPGHPNLSLLLFLLPIGIIIEFKNIIWVLASIIAILFDKERRDQFLGFDNDKEDKK